MLLGEVLREQAGPAVLRRGGRALRKTAIARREEDAGRVANDGESYAAASSHLRCRRSSACCEYADDRDDGLPACAGLRVLLRTDQSGGDEPSQAASAGEASCRRTACAGTAWHRCAGTSAANEGGLPESTLMSCVQEMLEEAHLRHSGVYCASDGGRAAFGDVQTTPDLRSAGADWTGFRFGQSGYSTRWRSDVTCGGHRAVADG